MKERILLFIIVLGLTAFIYIFQSYTVWGLTLLVSLMALYALFTNIAYKIKTRNEQKCPRVKNESYKPFVSIMIPLSLQDGYVLKESVEVSIQYLAIYMRR